MDRKWFIVIQIQNYLINSAAIFWCDDSLATFSSGPVVIESGALFFFFLGWIVTLTYALFIFPFHLFPRNLFCHFLAIRLTILAHHDYSNQDFNAKSDTVWVRNTAYLMFICVQACLMCYNDWLCSLQNVNEHKWAS